MAASREECQQSDQVQAEGGWDFEFIDNVDKDYECIVCLLPMREPYLTKCGHCMCRVCLDKILATNAECPEDRRPITANDIFPDERLNRKIMALRVKCLYSDVNRNWAGELVDLLKKHLEICKVELVPCRRDECTDTPKREDFKSHVEKLCKWRPINCDYCSEEIVSCKIEGHLDKDCEKIIIACPSGCGELFERRELLKHTREVCMNREMECPFAEFGCKEPLIRYGRYCTYYDDFGCCHKLLVDRFCCRGYKVNGTEEFFPEIYSRPSCKVPEVIMKQMESHLTVKVGTHLILLKEQFLSEKRKYQEEVEKLKEQFLDERRKREEEDGTLKRQLLREERQCREVINKVFQLFIEKDDVQLLTSLEDESIWSDLRSLREDKIMFKNYIRFLKEEHYFDRHEVPNCPSGSWVYENDQDDVLAFLIRMFSKKRQLKDSVFSPILPVGKEGYRVQIMSYPAGIKSGGGTHISLFLRLQPGPLDENLVWPFRKTFRLAVLNVKNPFNSRIQTISISDLEREGLDMRNFQRPEEINGNNGYGYSQHTKLKDIENIPGFLVNDTVIVKVSIEKHV